MAQLASAFDCYVAVGIERLVVRAHPRERRDFVHVQCNNACFEDDILHMESSAHFYGQDWTHVRDILSDPESEMFSRRQAESTSAIPNESAYEAMIQESLPDQFLPAIRINTRQDLSNFTIRLMTFSFLRPYPSSTFPSFSSSPNTRPRPFLYPSEETKRGTQIWEQLSAIHVR